MHLAVAQLAVVQSHFLGTLAGLLGHSGNCLALLLRLLNLAKHHFGNVWLAVQEVVKLLLYEVVDEFIYRRSAFPHHRASELYLRLRLEDWFYHLYADGRHYAVANVGILKILCKELLDSARKSLAECRLVSSALGGVLTVDKRVELLAILCRVCDYQLYVLVLEVD